MYAQQAPADPSSSEGEEEAGKAKRNQSEEHRLAGVKATRQLHHREPRLKSFSKLGAIACS